MVVVDAGHAAKGCCEEKVKCCCRWRSEHPPRNAFSVMILSSRVLFFLGCVAVYGSIGLMFFWFFIGMPPHAAGVGCREDSEGSWSIGVFYGASPFSLKPIESMNKWKKEVAAWPIANPVFTCSSASDVSFPSNFVADPFLYQEGDDLFLFYETKNSITMQGDIGVARSVDKGATWEQLGIALDEDWHLSYPYVFNYHGKVYMMPESSKNGELWLYRAIDFPLKWTMEKVLIKKPLVDSVLIHHGGVYWIFGSDHSGYGAKKNGQMEIWYSDSPLGPWKPHKRNPIHNGDKRMGARNGGRPFVHDGKLYRVGQDSGETYGRRIRVFKVEILNEEEYKEVEVNLGFEESHKGRNSWNGARYHHLDAQQLRNGEWIAVMDGDRVPSGDSVRRFLTGCLSLAAAMAIAVILGFLIGAVKLHSGKRSYAVLNWEQAKVRRLWGRLNRGLSSLRVKFKFKSWAGKSFIVLLFLAGTVFTCISVRNIFGGNGAETPYPVRGYSSQFTLLTMTYDARLWNLKMYVKHYSRCASVKEIVVVWNKGVPPDPGDFDSAVPVRIRREEKNSLNNRFKKDPLITTRSVLELDDDIMMTCDDVERGFNVWRQHPDRIVGFYPRLIRGKKMKYRAEKYAREHNGYNIILTGAAFIDSKFAFDIYWDEMASSGRDWVEKNFNCEDVLMNYLYANASSSRTVDYVKPRWAIDTSKVSGAAISKDTQSHYRLRSNCLRKFSEMYGSISDRKSEFGSRKDGWDM